jgi:pSer/pThr/pTyr-binding forkhead associated (FHA) protein
MSNEERKRGDEEALPTQNVGPDAKLFEVQGQINTNELLIVSFYMPGRSDPVIVNGMKTITIGRRDPKRQINPTIDLTEDHGAKLGVSRMHAELNFVNGQYYVKDTGSSNGTWVNDTKLQPYQPHPVNSGDQVRIGQVAIMVHLSLPQRNATGAEDISTLIDSAAVEVKYRSYKISDSTGGIMVEDNSLVFGAVRTLSTYLEHVSRIVKIIREAQQQENKPFAVTAIRMRSIDNTMIVDVSEGLDVMDFLGEKLQAFIKVIEGKQKGDKKQTDSLQRYSEPMQQIADYMVQELVFRFLNEQRDDYVKRLGIHIDALVTTHFMVAPTTSS